ncbi:hypothetical protein [Kocuria tytonis]|uniref:Uncharacterized protein n=1 Tax=Kocuria tytonis TaxID=2054280 RepID=A0A495A5S4_9MICC|nr:hypothetical protein [Kocuria tytonis]RKQ35089.1 hypothetical protein C1C97_007425 [Kocuria tytonis]
MAQRTEHTGRRRTDIKGPLIISAVLAVVAFVVVSVAAAGGTDNAARVGLGLIAAGIAFIASVVVCATLMLLEKPNAEELGQGTGVNRSSAKIFAENKARRDAERARQAGQQGGASTAASDGPEFGQRVHTDTKGEEPGSSVR